MHGSLVSSSAPQTPKLRSDCCQIWPSIAWKVPRSERSWSARSKGAVTNELGGGGFPLDRTTEDREELAIDVRPLEAMLRASSDPEVGIGALAIGFRVVPVQRCPGIRSCTPRRMQEQRVQQEVDEELAAKGLWNQNYASAFLRWQTGFGTCCTNSRQLLGAGRLGGHHVGSRTSCSEVLAHSERNSKCSLMAQMSTT